MYMYTCVYVHMCVYAHAYICIHMYMCTCIYVHMCVYAHAYICVYDVTTTCQSCTRFWPTYAPGQGVAKVWTPACMPSKSMSGLQHLPAVQTAGHASCTCTDA